MKDMLYQNSFWNEKWYMANDNYVIDKYIATKPLELYVCG